MRTVAIIQARLGSTRLPRKMLADINGHPLLWHVIYRTRQAKTLDGVVVATTTEPEDEAICKLAKSMGVPYFRGSRDDVLGRLYECAKEHKADVIVRITGDCPMIDAVVVERLMHSFDDVPMISDAPRYDYATNANHPFTWPDGLDVEVLSFNALMRLHNEAVLASDREHVTPYLRRHASANSGSFVMQQLNLAESNYSHLRFCVDNPQDLVFARAVFAELGNDFAWTDVVGLLDRKPEIAAMMGTAKRNEGYEKSLREDSNG